VVDVARPADGALLLSTEGSSFDTVMAMYVGDLVNALTPVASSDDAAPVPASAGFRGGAGSDLYQIAVDGYNGATGPCKN